ncbi:ABC transporter permease [Dysosmobacter sp.]|uniref:ABC transporter permease n=1 Tax=Dysosmobacter sp. TaxID=2591382 RepID=UPI002A8C9138|nr:iron ABC transporter permease [Dysosmobacter sp.]MDY3282106.1 iron ABC transporter permease [Dysosmobacter sp.]
MKTKRKFELWTVVSLVLLASFLLFLVYPMFGLLKQAVITPEGQFSLREFAKFFSKSYYTDTILNSVKVTVTVTIVSLLLGIPIAYFYSFYKIRGAKALFVLSILCSMSAPFIGAYSWIMLLGRSGAITQFLEGVLGISVGSIYGFKGILIVQSLKFFPLVFIYMNGAFKNIDNTLMEASANMGCTGVRRLVSIVLALSMPTILAAALMVFMQAFADFGTPMLLGEGFQTFPVLIYNQYLGENGQNFNFAAALATIAIIITAIVFFFQKWATSRFKFSMNALHPVEKKDCKGISGFLMHAYCYILVAVAFMPQLYIIYLSFRNCKGAIFHPGFSLGNYQLAVKKLLVRSIKNTAVLGVVALAIIIVIAVLIAYLVVRRSSALNNAIDTLSMLPYIMPGAVIGLALLIAFGKKPFALTGTLAIMAISLVIRRLPYTIRSATATLMQISMSIEEASISLGASKAKTFVKITVPMMANGILSGAILSWVAIVTELSSSIILYNNKSITLTMSTYVAITRGNYGLAAAFAAILTVVTTVSLLIYLWVSKSEDVSL